MAMLSLSLLLHLHQPPTQFPEVLRLVFQQSYKPLLEFLSENQGARVTLNITASLVEQLVALGMGEWLEELKELVAEGRVELTGTAAYHPLLPKLPEAEVARQIKLEESALGWLFPRSDLRGEGRTFKGFFPPEMGVDETTVRLIGEMGYTWVAVDEAALRSDISNTSNVSNISDKSKKDLEKSRGGFYRYEGLTLAVRNKDLSLKLAFGQIRNLDDLLSYANNYKLITNNFIVALDGETFGHHHPELLPFLEELLANSGTGDYQLVTVSELIREHPSSGSVKIRSATWSDGFERWHDPDNVIHQKQWQLTALAIAAVNNSQYLLKTENGKQKTEVGKQKTEGGQELSVGQKHWLKARQLLDRALHSDQYWWASARPNWHYKMVERGARMLRDVVSAVPDARALRPKDDRSLAEGADRLYKEITRLGLEKYGDTVTVDFR